MYGSSRLGIWSRKVDMDVVPPTGGTAPLLGTIGIDTFNRGNEFFELANHLGNVLVTVSDRKVGQNPVNGLYTSFSAEVTFASDYAPFGMQMVGRTFSTGSYRCGFNGKENDNEIKGEGNQQDYSMRIYDPRIGKFLSVDPLTKKYPMLSAFQFASNSPITGVDMDGLEFMKYDVKNKSTIVFPKNYESDGLLKKEFEFAQNAHMNVLVAGTMSDINKYLAEKGRRFENILFTGHGAFNNSIISMGNYGYKLEDLEKYQDEIKELSKYIKKDGSIILLGCFQATPKYEEKNYPYIGELVDINLDGETLTKKLSAITNRKVVGNAGETYSGSLEFSGSHVQNFVATGQLKKLSERFAGQWSVTTPNQKIEYIGSIILNPDGTYKIPTLPTLKKDGNRASSPSGNPSIKKESNVPGPPNN